jgi:phage terminase large subunit-like protein
VSWSKAKTVASWTAEKQREFIDNLSPEQLSELHLQPWYWIGRPEQQLPEGDWLIWLLMTGRGFGKTRTALECFVLQMVALPEWEGTPTQWGVIGETFADCRNILIEGPAGLVGILNRLKIPYAYNKSLWQIVLGTGQVIHMLGADNPDVGRGYNFAGLVMDEFAKWRNGKRIWQEGLHFTLRVGPKPRAIVATTPKMGNSQLKEWLDNPRVVVTKGALDDNADNLPDSFIEGIAEQYAGTRLERQERYGELIEEVEGALWQYDDILVWRGPIPELMRTVVAIDPAITNTENSDETGIVCASRTKDGDFIVFADRTIKASPRQWAQRAIDTYHEFTADRIVYEDNHGGDAWGEIIHQIDPYIPVGTVHAQVGKRLRAEPIAALYEKHIVYHMAHFDKLEGQMTSWEPYDPKSKSPDRVDALVHALTELNPSGSKSRFISELMDFCPNPACGQANTKGQVICAHCGRPMNGL